MNKLTTSLWLSCLLTSGLTLHAQVDEGQVVPLVAGDPARAADLNQTTQALIDAINNNAAQMKALQEQISIVASVINLPQPSLAENLVGSQYKVHTLAPKHGTLENKVGLNEAVNFRHSIFAEEGTLTLNADNTSSYVFTGSEFEASLYLNLTYGEGPPEFPDRVTGADVLQGTFPDNGALPGTWSLVGNQLTVNMDGEGSVFTVSTDGSSLISGSNESYVDGGYNYRTSYLLAGVRIHKPIPNINVRIDNTGQASPPITDATNNGPHFHLIHGEPSNGSLIYIQNTGDAVLTLGSRALIQTEGTGMSIPGQIGSIDIAPGQEITIAVTDADIPPLGGDSDLTSIYLMTNDPDTPTFIVNVSSISTSGASPP